MAATSNDSSVLEGQQMRPALAYDPSNTLSSVMSYFCGGLSGWQLLLTALIILMTYDQGMKFSALLTEMFCFANTECSYVYQAEGVDCWAFF